MLEFFNIRSLSKVIPEWAKAPACIYQFISYKQCAIPRTLTGWWHMTIVIITAIHNPRQWGWKDDFNHMLLSQQNPIGLQFAILMYCSQVSCSGLFVRLSFCLFVHLFVCPLIIVNCISSVLVVCCFSWFPLSYLAYIHSYLNLWMELNCVIHYYMIYHSNIHQIHK